MSSSVRNRERKKLYRSLYQTYLSEGYDHKLAKKMAREEADEISEVDEEYIKEIFNATYEDDVDEK